MSTTLEEACLAIVDCEHKTAPIDVDGRFFAIGTPAMRGNRIDYSLARRISESTFAEWTRRLLPRVGDLLLAREAPVGPVVAVPDGGRVAPGQRTVLLRPDPERLDSAFAYYLLSSPEQQARLLQKAEGSTVPHLNVADVRSFMLPDLPPLEEQRAIAATLGALDDKIESNRRATELSWSLLRAEHEALVADGRLVRLGDLFGLHYGKALPATLRRSGTVPVFGSGGVTGYHDTALVLGPAVIVGRKGSVGEIFWSTVPSFPIDTTFYVSTRSDYPLLSSFFLLRAANLQDMNSDSAVPGLNRQAALDLTVRAPLAEAAFRWAERRRVLVDKAEQLSQETVRLAALRDTLLPELLSGRLRVGDVAA